MNYEETRRTTFSKPISVENGKMRPTRQTSQGLNKYEEKFEEPTRSAFMDLDFNTPALSEDERSALMNEGRLTTFDELAFKTIDIFKSENIQMKALDILEAGDDGCPNFDIILKSSSSDFLKDNFESDFYENKEEKKTEDFETWQKREERRTDYRTMSI